MASGGFNTRGGGRYGGMNCGFTRRCDSSQGGGDTGPVRTAPAWAPVQPGNSSSGDSSTGGYGNSTQFRNSESKPFIPSDQAGEVQGLAGPCGGGVSSKITGDDISDSPLGGQGEATPEELLFESSARAKVFNRTRYGLLGILRVIRMTDPDLNTLTLGTDLTSMGLDLNASDCLYNSFASPLSDTPARKDLSLLLPACFVPATQPPIRLQHFQRFADRTLLYIFHCCTRLLIQGWAAVELYRREWRYHLTLNRWMIASKDGVRKGTDATDGDGVGTSTNVEKTDANDSAAASAGGRWSIFNVEAWELVPFDGSVDPKLFLTMVDLKAYLEEGIHDADGLQEQQMLQMQQLHQEHQHHVSQQQMLQTKATAETGASAAPAGVGQHAAVGSVNTPNAIPPS